VPQTRRSFLLSRGEEGDAFEGQLFMRDQRRALIMCILTQHGERVDEDLPTAQNIEGGNTNSKYARNTIKLLNREGNSERRDTDNNTSQGS